MIAASTITSPIAAFREISPPHVGPTSSMFTSTGSMPACSASSRRITSDSLIPSPVSEGVRIDTASSFTIWTSAPSIPCSSSVACTCSASTGRANVYVMRAPPSKSIEKFRSPNRRPASETATSSPEIANQRFRSSTQRTCGIV